MSRIRSSKQGMICSSIRSHHHRPSSSYHQSRSTQSFSRTYRIKKTEKKIKDAALEAARSEILLPQEAGFIEAEGPIEQTWRVSQDEVRLSGLRKMDIQEVISILL